MLFAFFREDSKTKEDKERKSLLAELERLASEYAGTLGQTDDGLDIKETVLLISERKSLRKSLRAVILNARKAKISDLEIRNIIGQYFDISID